MTGAGEQPRAHGDYARAEPAGARRSLSVDGSAGVPRLTCSVQQAQIVRPAPRREQSRATWAGSRRIPCASARFASRIQPRKTIEPHRARAGPGWRNLITSGARPVRLTAMNPLRDMR